MMVAAISGTASNNSSRSTNPKLSATDLQNSNSRPPLLPSERGNGLSTRRPKAREISSRYLSSTSSSSSSSSSINSTGNYASSRRYPSPVISRTAPEPAIKRSQSAGRRRPSTPLPESKSGNVICSDVSSSKTLWTSTRSLSVSFQGESFSLPISKTKTPIPNLSALRKASPERRRSTPSRGKADVERGNVIDNSKSTIEQHRWPSTSRQLNMNSLTRSLDCTGNINRNGGSLTAIQTLQQSIMAEGRRTSFDGRFQVDACNSDTRNSKVTQSRLDTDSCNGSTPLSCDLSTSDSESVSSGSNSGSQFNGSIRTRGLTSVNAKLWPESNSRRPGSPLSPSLSKTKITAKLVPPKNTLLDSPRSSPKSTSTCQPFSPLKGSNRYSSPSKLSVSTTSPSRAMTSPSRTRGLSLGSIANQSNGSLSLINFATDVRRGRMGERRIEEAHLLRLLYNRYLQWRFVNAKSDAASMLQSVAMEKTLYNAWLTVSELREAVTLKKMRLRLLKQSLKLHSILKGQMTYLEEWCLLERNQLSSLSGAVESLKASTLRLPVVDGARADTQRVKDAINSAVDVMQAMGSSICFLLKKAEGMNSLVAELANVALQERAVIGQCRDLLSIIAALQVKESSLRTQILQLKSTPGPGLTLM